MARNFTDNHITSPYQNEIDRKVIPYSKVSSGASTCYRSILENGFNRTISCSRIDLAYYYSKECHETMTDQSTGSWGGLGPIMPAFIRLIASIIVLVIVEAIFLGFNGTTSAISGTPFTVAGVAIFIVGFIVALILLRFGSQLASAVSDAYKAYRAWSPLLSYFFQVAAIVILYVVSNPIASPYFTSFPWGYPLIFLMIALLPTLKVVVNVVHILDGTTGKHGQNN
jgi:hypothetical protein